MDLNEAAKQFDEAQQKLASTLKGSQMEDFKTMVQCFIFSLDVHARNAQLIASLYREAEALRDNRND